MLDNEETKKPVAQTSPTEVNKPNQSNQQRKSFFKISSQAKAAIRSGKPTAGAPTQAPNTRHQKRSPFNRNESKSADERNKRKVEAKTKSEYEERVIKINRISKTTKGGRNLRFSALVVVGNRRGKVGYGIAKALEVPNAIKKALRAAEKNVGEVAINKHGTIYHSILGRSGAARVLLKPAPAGTGIIAGGPIRAVIELAGYTDIYTKNLGKNTPVNMIQATLNGIFKQLTPRKVAKLRDKELKDL